MPLKYFGADFLETVDRLADFEAAGVDRVMIAEAYSFDAVSLMGYVAARTTSAELAFGILPMFSRTPTNLAMTAAGVDLVSGGRCVLGIGASGPQVVEGFHGVKYDAPVARAREHVEICRKIWRREPTDYRGKYYTLPLAPDDGGSGLGKALRIIGYPVRDRIPMGLAAIGPNNVQLAAELFEEWQPFLFYPERLDEAFGEAVKAGTARRDPALGPLGIVVQMPLLITETEAEAEQARRSVREHAALYIGGMGARGHNFYNMLAARYGFAQEARVIQDLYLSGDRAAAAASVPDDLVRGISLIGPAEHIGERVTALAGAGVTCVLAEPLAATHEDRVAQMATVKGIVADVASGNAVA
ncbi:LLM class F420-dependent oxidoreductase [Mycobacterium sp. shizuoka-1]|uniref:LLM class F420-dependent oxidoreductase n=1 Tax=Mycobacterium sp. shizuoka-1 TaxID=2039281 RepID=UPI001E605BFA|nr:LLM class F420-dependent oxidoreductase [Mycobacterium sp. shizuoka-1]